MAYILSCPPLRCSLLPGLLIICSTLIHAGATTSLYRWTDSEGNHHFGDREPTKGGATERISIDSDAYFGVVKKVYDGDTVQLQSGVKVRLIGINTPEVAKRNRPGDSGGIEAKAFLSRQVLGKKVRLVPGPERYDKYQRLLATLYSVEGEDLNARMLDEGLAHSSIKPPNIQKLVQYRRIEDRAIARKRGIWSLSRYQPVPIEDAGEYRNTFRRLQGRVNSVEENRSAWLLHFANDVKVLIRKEHLDSFRKADLEPKRLKGREILFRGWVHQSRGTPLIRLVHVEAIESVQ